MRYLSLLCTLLVVSPAAAAAQHLPLAVDATAGYAGLVDDVTKRYVVAGGAVRKYLTPRLSIGPEVVVMQGGDVVGDRIVMVTGNVVYDFRPFYAADPARVTPFVTGGLGGFWIRDDLPAGTFWAWDPAFTAGAGVRGRVHDRVSVAGEYRIGWELHQRITGSVTFELR